MMQRLLNHILLALYHDFRVKKATPEKERNQLTSKAYAHANQAVQERIDWCSSEIARLKISGATRKRKNAPKHKQKQPKIAPNATTEIARLEREVLELGRWATCNLAWAGRCAEKEIANWLEKGCGALPQRKPNQPILLRGAELEYHEGVLSLALRNRGRFRVAVVPTTRRKGGKIKGPVWEAIRQVLSREAITRDGKIIFDERSKEWHVVITVIRPKPKIEGLSKDRVLVVKRGRYYFLSMMSNVGHWVAIKGDKIKETKRRLIARLKKLVGTREQRGRGARGHGKKRFFSAETKLRKTEAQFTDTECKNAAAAVVDACRKVGAGRVLLEKWTTIEDQDLRYELRWPWYKQREKIVWACKKSGIEVIDVEAEHICTTCPRCGGVMVRKSHKDDDATMHCACDFSRPADFIACVNMMAREPSVDMSWMKRDRKVFEGEIDASTVNGPSKSEGREPGASGVDQGTGEPEGEPGLG